MVGRLFREFAVTLSVAVMISLVISLTTTPMMCAWLLKPPRADEAQAAAGRLARVAERGFDAVHARLRAQPRLGAAATSRWCMLILVVGRSASTSTCTSRSPRASSRSRTPASINGGMRADQSISFQAMRRKLRQLVDIIRDDPAVETVVGFTGGCRAGGGFLFVDLKPLGERKDSGRR